MALDNTTTVPKIVAATLLAKLRQSQVFAARTNATYRSQLNEAGDEVIINTPADAAISDYTANGTVTYNNADVGSPVTLSLTKRKAWGVKLDDLNKAASRPDVMASAVAEHAVKLAETTDADVRAAMDAGATDGPALTVDHSGNKLMLDSFKFATLHRLLDLNNVSRSNRFLIVGPYAAEALQRLALKNDVLLAGTGTESLANGSIGSFGGFNISVAPGAYSTYNTTSMTATETVFFGTDEATAFIDRVNKTERLRLQETFADAVRGLYEYGYKVIDSKRIFKSAMTVNKVPQ